MMMINPMLMACKAAGPAEPQTLFLCNYDTDIIGSRAVTIVVPEGQFITGYQSGTSERNEYYIQPVPYGDTPDAVTQYCPAMSASLAGLSLSALTVEAWIEYLPAYTIKQSLVPSYPANTPIYVDNYDQALTLIVGTTQFMGWYCTSSQSAASGKFWSSCGGGGTNYNSETGEEVTLTDTSETYHHLAIVADGSTLSWYCDGTRRRQETYAAVGWPAGNLALGALQCQALDAYSAVRVSSGVRYSGATYTAPSHPLSA